VEPDRDAAFEWSDHVVFGTVRAVTELHLDGKQVELSVEESFKGASAGSLLRVTIESGSSCSLYPAVGQHWVWYVRDGRSGMCTRSTPVDLDQVGPPHEARPGEPNDWVPRDLRELYDLRRRASEP
jgi:hypothetical protein